MSKIELALTAKEWAEIKEEAEVWEYTSLLDAYGLVAASDCPHAAAALCLHNQPFGFTWKDVELVQMWIDAKKHSDQLEGFVQRMESFRDRLAALLPPKK